MKSKKYIIYLLVTILTLSIGLTYAYFKGRVTGEGKDISLKVKAFMYYIQEMQL